MISFPKNDLWGELELPTQVFRGRFCEMFRKVCPFFHLRICKMFVSWRLRILFAEK